LKGAGRAWWLALAAALVLAALPACSARQELVQPPPSAPNPAPGPVGPPRYFLYVPPSLPAGAPARLLLVLHGIGGNGPDIARVFEPVAQEHGWIVAAPTFVYGDWRSPAAVRGEDVRLDRQLSALLDDVPWRSGHPLRGRLLLAGFSRGAQLADRFALFHPERVAAVASLSAGTYTLPEDSADLDGDGEPDDLPLPFGTSDMTQWVGHALDANDLRRVHFLVCVGGDDTNPADLPRQWDPLLGSTRVSRAYVFEHALELLRVPAQLTVFPGAKHQLTAAMAVSAGTFLGKI
jgi:pimeloyl-ACP methyl ester carboxylesterase